MRVALWALALLLAVDAALCTSLRRLSGERAELVRLREELLSRAGSIHDEAERVGRIQSLLRTGSQSIGGLSGELDIAALRDLLLGAERGLAIDRFSLDFRPEQDTSGSRDGGRVALSLGGSFDAVCAYLARLESHRLPLATSALSLRQEDSGRVLLAIEWQGRWNRGERALEELSAAEIERLEKWLRREPAPPTARNPFSQGQVSTEAGIPGAVFESPAPLLPAPPTDAEPVIAPPRLEGFVMARPELEVEVGRRVLAAIRIEDQLLLMGLGDTAGSYTVVEIEPRESVLLVHQGTGERLKLVLE